jgi:large subunit ribosomal protein L24e
MKCTVCGKEMPTGTGTTFVWNDGRIVYYCGSKCRANVGLGREPARINWIRKKK